MSEYDNRGQVALWKSKSENPKAPNAKGSVVAHRDIREGEELDIALWRNDSENPNAPVMKGKISDRMQNTQSGAQNTQGGYQTNSHQESGSGDSSLDDDVPF